MVNDLSSLRICTQKFTSKDTNTLKILHDTANSSQHYQKLKAAFHVSKIWENYTEITISFVNYIGIGDTVKWTSMDQLEKNDDTFRNIDPLEYKIRDLTPKSAIQAVVMYRIQPLTGLKFRFVNSGGMVRIGLDPNDGSWSYVGTDCLNIARTDRTMNFGWLDCKTIMHEFGHMLGMIHEHQNSKEFPIKWNDDLVYAWAKKTQNWDVATTDANILTIADITEINGSVFDSKSIMLYFFPSQLTLNGVGTESNGILSREDVKWITTIYPGGMSPTDFYREAYENPTTDPVIPVEPPTTPVEPTEPNKPTEPNEPNKIDVLNIVLYIILCLIAICLIYAIIRYLLYR
jgi:hypothetical protein